MCFDRIQSVFYFILLNFLVKICYFLSSVVYNLIIKLSLFHIFQIKRLFWLKIQTFFFIFIIFLVKNNKDFYLHFLLLKFLFDSFYNFTQYSFQKKPILGVLSINFLISYTNSSLKSVILYQIQCINPTNKIPFSKNIIWKKIKLGFQNFIIIK